MYTTSRIEASEYILYLQLTAVIYTYYIIFSCSLITAIKILGLFFLAELAVLVQRLSYILSTLCICGDEDNLRIGTVAV